MKLTDQIINDYFCCDPNLKILIDWFQCGNKLKKVLAYEICCNLLENITRINKIRSEKNKDEIVFHKEKEYLKSEILNLISNKYHYSNFKIDYSKNLKWMLSSYFCLFDEYTILQEFTSQNEVSGIKIWTMVAYLNNCTRKQESYSFFRKDFQNPVCNYLSKIVLSEIENDTREEIFHDLENNKNIDLFKAICNFCPPFFVNKLIHLLDKNANEISTNFTKDRDIWYHYYLIKCIERIKTLEDTSEYDFDSVCISLLKYVNGLNHASDHGPWIAVKNKILAVLEKFTNDVKNLSINNLNNLLSNPNYETILKSFKILETSLGLDSALKTVIKNFNTSYQSFINKDEYLILTSSALKWLNRKDGKILNKLEEVMNGYNNEEQDMARKLIVEIGGKSAMRRLGAREQLKKKYYETMDVAQDKVNKMFQTTMGDAKKGFMVALGMDIMIFFIGVVLISITGFIAAFNNDTENWAGIGASGGTGVLSVMYSMFFSKPRQQVKDNVNHMMNLKIIFLAYLRELNQLDQSFSQKMIESDGLTENDITFFKQKLKDSMSEAVNILQLVRKNNEIPNENTPLVRGNRGISGRNSSV
jgi:hypothetical protein